LAFKVEIFASRAISSETVKPGNYTGPKSDTLRLSMQHIMPSNANLLQNINKLLPITKIYKKNNDNYTRQAIRLTWSNCGTSQSERKSHQAKLAISKHRVYYATKSKITPCRNKCAQLWHTVASRQWSILFTQSEYFQNILHIQL